MFSYDEAARPVGELLVLAGRLPRVHYPFVRMSGEPFWEWCGEVSLNASGDVSRIDDLCSSSVRSGYQPEFTQLLRETSSCRIVVDAIAERWLDTELRVRAARWLEQQGLLP
jgi:hypothetical protein